MNYVFQFHLTERVTRQLLRDPQLPNDPTFGDTRAALARLDAQEAEDNNARQAQDKADRERRAQYGHQ